MITPVMPRRPANDETPINRNAERLETAIERLAGSEPAIRAASSIAGLRIQAVPGQNGFYCRSFNHRPA